MPGTLAWLAPADDAFDALVEAGLTASADTLLERFEAAYGEALRGAGADVLSADRQGWDEERGRGPGAPGEEIVTRARGDLNRALLVE